VQSAFTRRIVDPRRAGRAPRGRAPAAVPRRPGAAHAPPAAGLAQRTGRAAHRWSTDDLVTGWLAGEAVAAARAAAGAAAGAGAGAPRWPARCLDLGCGIGSVLLMVAWQFPGAACLGIEAQASGGARSAGHLWVRRARKRSRRWKYVAATIH
jgi:L-aminopeptidase/D-esterase-like protein